MKESSGRDAESGKNSVAYCVLTVIIDLLTIGLGRIQHSGH
jgi:hypothetical protein